MKWDGVKKDFPAWERDHSLDSAIKCSVVWFFQRAAASIGRERELQHLRAFGYGSQRFQHEVTSFWLNGDLAISPREQVAFLIGDSPGLFSPQSPACYLTSMRQNETHFGSVRLQPDLSEADQTPPRTSRCASPRSLSCSVALV